MKTTKLRENVRSKKPQPDRHQYGVYREKPQKDTHDAGWRVCIQRRGKIVSRNFKDAIYGSPEAALDEAKAYRDAIMATLHPTNREHAVQLRKNNRSGIAGIYRGSSTSGPYWEAQIHAGSPEAKRVKFAIAKYGEAKAKSLAVAKRQQWLSEWPLDFFGAVNPCTKSNDRQQLIASQDEEPDVMPRNVPNTDLKTQLAEVDAQFDAARPSRLRVTVRCSVGSRRRMGVVVSDAGQPARKKQIDIGLRRQTLAEALGKARSRIQLVIADLYNADIACWFIQNHGNILDCEHFQPDVGVSVLAFVPNGLAGERVNQKIATTRVRKIAQEELVNRTL